jgi:hypothetical protein
VRAPFGVPRPVGSQPCLLRKELSSSSSTGLGQATLASSRLGPGQDRGLPSEPTGLLYPDMHGCWQRARVLRTFSYSFGLFAATS